VDNEFDFYYRVTTLTHSLALGFLSIARATPASLKGQSSRPHDL